MFEGLELYSGLAKSVVSAPEEGDRRVADSDVDGVVNDSANDTGRRVIVEQESV